MRKEGTLKGDTRLGETVIIGKFPPLEAREAAAKQYTS